jgi:hypothetical protein
MPTGGFLIKFRVHRLLRQAQVIRLSPIHDRDAIEGVLHDDCSASETRSNTQLVISTDSNRLYRHMLQPISVCPQPKINENPRILYDYVFPQFTVRKVCTDRSVQNFEGKRTQMKWSKLSKLSTVGSLWLSKRIQSIQLLLVLCGSILPLDFERWSQSAILD